MTSFSVRAVKFPSSSQNTSGLTEKSLRMSSECPLAWLGALFSPLSHAKGEIPVHNWTRLSDGTFHDFHYSWVLEIKRALKRGLLLKGYYVMAEQLGVDPVEADVPILQASSKELDFEGSLSTMPDDAYARMQRTLVIRHRSGDRIVAMIEVLSRGNKSSRHAIRSFLDKAVAALDSGIHFLLIDVHPPGPH